MTTPERTGNRRKMKLLHSHDFTIKYEDRDIVEFSISTIGGGDAEFAFLDFDTKRDSKKIDNQPFYSEYNYVTISIDRSVPEVPRYKVVQELRESNDVSPPVIVRQRWFPMNAVSLEIEEEEEEDR